MQTEYECVSSRFRDGDASRRKGYIVTRMKRRGDAHVPIQPRARATYLHEYACEGCTPPSLSLSVSVSLSLSPFPSYYPLSPHPAHSFAGILIICTAK